MLQMLRSGRLSTRLALSFAALFAFAFTAAVGVTLYFATNWLDTAIDDSVESLTETAEERILVSGIAPERVLADLSSATQFLEFRSPQGEVLASSANLDGRVLPVRSSLFNAERARTGTTRLENSRVRVSVRPLRTEDETLLGFVVAGSPVPELGTQLRDFLIIISGTGAGGLVITLVGTLWLSRRIAAPIQDLAEGVRATAASEFDTPLTLPSGGGEEVRDLGNAVAELIDLQRERLARERAFFADSSHILRTPLTVLRGNLDFLSDRSAPAEERAVAFEHARSSLDAMSRTVNGLLLLARERELDGADWEVIDLSEALRSQADAFASAHRDLAIEAQVEAGLEVAGNPGQVTDLFAALIENACRYTPPGGRVVVAAGRDGDVARVTVADTGIGLSDEDARRATERFYRGSQARQMAPSGSGLGLAIATRIAEIHGGSLAIRPNEDDGATVTAMLPLLF